MLACHVARQTIPISQPSSCKCKCENDSMLIQEKLYNPAYNVMHLATYMLRSTIPNDRSSMQESLKTPMTRRRHIQTPTMPSLLPNRTLTFIRECRNLMRRPLLRPIATSQVSYSDASNRQHAATRIVSRVSVAISSPLGNRWPWSNQDLSNAKSFAVGAGV